jgi:hypothetical protein
MHVCMNVCRLEAVFYIRAGLSRMHVKLFALELAGQERQLSRFPVSNKAFGEFEIQTSLNGKSARHCFSPGQLKFKQLYVCVSLETYMRACRLVHVCVHVVRDMYMCMCLETCMCACR